MIKNSDNNHGKRRIKKLLNRIGIQGACRGKIIEHPIVYQQILKWQ